MNNSNYDYGMFPLRIFLFPGEQTTLHIFEPRYLQLVSECLSNNEFFGIPYQGKTTLSELGSLVKVNQILKKYESGELDVLIECQSNFKIHHFQNKNEHKLYPLGSLSKIQKKLFTPTDQLIDHASNYLSHLLDDSKESKREELISLNNLTNLVNLTDEEKIRFIGLNEEKKNDFLVQKFKFMLILLTQEKMVDQNFYLN
jgi:ATP-dependent Lon protease